MGGTILNTITVLIGSTLGLLVGNRLSERIQESVITGLGLCDPTYRGFAPTWPDEAFAIRKKR